MANSSMGMPALTGCPFPFLDESNFPYSGGYRDGRYCGRLAAGAVSFSCCTPCPLEDWVYSEAFPHKVNGAYQLNIPGLVFQAFLLLTFLVLPEDKSHKHYLSVGLCISLIMLELSFLVPLGTKPDMCYDAITPGDMHTSISCAWSGALQVTAAMAIVLWILLRSVWLNLRVCWNIKQSPAFFWISQAVGWGLPAIFLAISVPVTGLSYRLGPTCSLNRDHAVATWSAWLISFAGLAAIIQFWTTGYCVGLYAKRLISKDNTGKLGVSNGTMSSTKPLPGTESARRLAWRRVANVLKLQWRSVSLCVLFIVQTVFFGVVFVQDSNVTSKDLSPSKVAAVMNWTKCIAMHGGNKNACLPEAKALGIDEDKILASIFLNATLGIHTFTLMVRWSMFKGWWEFIKHPRLSSRSFSTGGEDFFVVGSGETMRKSVGKPLGSELLPRSKAPNEVPSVPPLPQNASSHVAPEAGDVSKRHDTTTLFDEHGEEGGILKNSHSPVDTDDDEDEEHEHRRARDDLV